MSVARSKDMKLSAQRGAKGNGSLTHGIRPALQRETVPTNRGLEKRTC